MCVHDMFACLFIYLFITFKHNIVLTKVLYIASKQQDSRAKAVLGVTHYK